MKGVLTPLIQSGTLSDASITLEQARAAVLTTLESGGRSAKDKQQIKQMAQEVQKLPTLEKVQQYVFNSYLKFNGQGVI